MKKYLRMIAFSLMAILGLTLTACDNDDDIPGAGDLVGTWDIVSVTYYAKGEEPDVEYPSDAYWVFTADKVTVHDKTDLANGKSVNYTYNSETKELHIVGFPLWNVTELTNSTLVMRSVEILDSYTITKFKKR